MKNAINLLVPHAVLWSLFSSAAIADASFGGQSNTGATSGIAQATALEKMIQQNTELKLAAETNKYAQIVAFAGDRQDELARRQSEVAATFGAWQIAKSAAEQTRNPGPDGFRAVALAAQAYAQANKSFIDLQKDILARNGASFDLVVAFNAAPPTAAGSR